MARSASLDMGACISKANLDRASQMTPDLRVSQSERSRFEGRFLDGQLVLIFGNVHCPEAGYSVDVRSGELYRNGELVGWARSLAYDRDALGWWVEYVSWCGSSLDHPEVVR